jgi:hypothetical protein
MEGVYEYAVEMGSGAMKYVLSFVKIGPSIQKLIEGIQRHTEKTEIA